MGGENSDCFLLFRDMSTATQKHPPQTLPSYSNFHLWAVGASPFMAAGGVMIPIALRMEYQRFTRTNKQHIQGRPGLASLLLFGASGLSLGVPVGLAYVTAYRSSHGSGAIKPLTGWQGAKLGMGTALISTFYCPLWWATMFTFSSLKGSLPDAAGGLSGATFANECERRIRRAHLTPDGAIHDKAAYKAQLRQLSEQKLHRPLAWRLRYLRYAPGYFRSMLTVIVGTTGAFSFFGIPMLLGTIPVGYAAGLCATPLHNYVAGYGFQYYSDGSGMDEDEAVLSVMPPQ